MNNLLLPPGDVRTLHGEVGAWALSPDGAWLAVGDALPGPDGQCALRCLEVATGRVVFEKWGGEVKGVAWHGSESLLALRVQGALTTRAVLYAVPDGAAVGGLALEGLPGRRVRVSVSQGASPVAFVTPWRMETVLRERSRRRLACVLTLDPFELALAWDPDATSAVPRLPEVRPAAMALSPDGHRMAVWLGEGSVAGAHGVGRGALFTVARDGGGEVRVCEAGRLVAELTWLDADTLLLRSAWGTEAQHRGEVEVVSISRAEVTYST